MLRMLLAATMAMRLLQAIAPEPSCNAHSVSHDHGAMMFQTTTTPLQRQTRTEEEKDQEEEKNSQDREAVADLVEQLDHQVEHFQAGVLAIPLQRVYSKSNDMRSVFVGNITVGHPPQKFSVVFDTSSGQVLLPHKVCQSRACKNHRRYSCMNSLSSEDIDANGARLQKKHRLAIGRIKERDLVTTGLTFADFGKGTSDALLVRDRVCLLGANSTKVCSWPAIDMAVKMDMTPFYDMPNDGFIGLGLTGGASSHRSFFAQLVDKSPKMAPQFGFSLGQHGGVLYVGGHGKAALAAPLQWFPVHSPEEGFWQLPIHAVRVGNITVDNCQRGCHALVDTSASRLGVQESNLPKLLAALTPGIARGADGRCIGPELQFDLGALVVRLGADDYTSDSHTCNPDLGSLDVQEPDYVGLYSFGDIVLQHYSVAFNWKDKTIGFALSTQEVQKVGSAHVTKAEVESIFM